MAGASLVFAVALGLAPAATGHALLQSSVPAAGSTVGTSPTTIQLVFGERPDPRLSSIRVLDTAGLDHASGAASADPSDSNGLVAPVEPLPDGVYTVSWRTVSAVDGHAAVGSFAFGVGVAPPRAGTTGAVPPSGLAAASPMAALSRLLLYAGLMAMLGAGLVALFVVPGRAAVGTRLSLAGSVLAAAGAVGVVGVQWAGAQADLRAILGTSLGVTGVTRLVAAALGVLAAAVAWRAATAGSPRRRARAVVALIGVTGVGLAIDVVGGHAAAVQPPILQLAFQWLHVAAASFWIGGLATVLLSIRDAVPDER